jgi:hypothetical protein
MVTAIGTKEIGSEDDLPRTDKRPQGLQLERIRDRSGVDAHRVRMMK